MTDDLLLIEKHPDGYAVLTLNRPGAMNALSSGQHRAARITKNSIHIFCNQCF